MHNYDDEVEKVYVDWNFMMNQTTAEDNSFVLEDMHATVGKGEEETIVGQYGFENIRGWRLIEFCAIN